jgi:hypothetical protein
VIIAGVGGEVVEQSIKVCARGAVVSRTVVASLVGDHIGQNTGLAVLVAAPLAVLHCEGVVVETVAVDVVGIDFVNILAVAGHEVAATG